MTERTELRGGLAFGRGLAAASAAAMLLVPSVSRAQPRAAAPSSAGWTKAWAERQLRIHFDATTVACLPLGGATRAAGASTFKEFVCGLVLVDGTRLTLHLKPRTRTAWTTVSLKRLGPSPEKKNGGGGGGPPAPAQGAQGQPEQSNGRGQAKGKGA